MILLSANNASTTLAAGLSSGATTIILAAGAGTMFPSLSANEYFTLTLSDALTQTVYEVCWCTARTGDSLTVLRGQEGTSARAWLIGDYAYNTLTAGSENSARAFSSTNTPALPFTIPVAHLGVTQVCTATGTITLPPPSTINDGFLCVILCASSSATITVNTNSATVTLPTGATTTTLQIAGLSASLQLQWSAGEASWYLTGQSLGFTPVQQGGGAGQQSNKVYIGWSGTKPKIQVDGSDLGNIALEPWAIASFNPGRWLGRVSTISSTSYTVPAGATLVHVKLYGGGGGGGYGNYGGGGGGGGAGYVDNIASVTPGDTIAVGIAGAGAGGTASTAATAGQTSTIYNGSGGELFYATGGQPGAAGASGGLGAGGAPGVGVGGPGGGSYGSVGGAGSATSSVILGGQGGDTFGYQGGPLTLLVFGTNGPGNNAQLGSGGSGGIGTGNGGNGGSGFAVIDWYSA